MQKADAAAFLANLGKSSSSSSTGSTNIHIMSGEVGEVSSDGIAKISVDGLVFSEEDDQFVEMPALGGLEEGDLASILLVGEDGKQQSPLALGSVGSIDRIRDLASLANEVANAINQFFWHDTNGAHVTQVPQEEWTDPENENYHSGPNALWNSLGMLFRNGTNNLLALLTNGLVIYDGEGNMSGNIIAKLLEDGIQLGRDNESNVVVEYNGLRMEDMDGEVYLDIHDARDHDGWVPSHIDEFLGNGTRTRFEVEDLAGEIYRVTVDGEDVEYTITGTYNDTVTISPAPASGAVVVIYQHKQGDSSYKSYNFGTRSGKEGKRSYIFGEELIASDDRAAAFGRYNTGELPERYSGDYFKKVAFSIGNGTADDHRSDAFVVTNEGDIECSTVNGTPAEYLAGMLDDVNATGGQENVPNGTNYSLSSIQITEPGVYILIGHCFFENNNSGRRVAGITTSDGGSLGATAENSVVSINPVSGSATSMMVIDRLEIPINGSAVDRYLTVYQNSGRALTAYGHITLIRVGPPSY